MSNNLPSKYEEKFIFKIKRFFLKLFGKKDRAETIQNISNPINITPEIKKQDIFSDMREQSKHQKLEKEILDIIEGNPELLETLSFEQLELISSNYNKIIEENDKKIKKLKRALAQ